MQGLLDIEPKQYLEFVQEDSKLGHTTLILKNLQDCEVAYKIKTTSPTLFQVKPCIGLIEANRSVTIDISTTQPIKDDDKLESKFQINAAQCQEQYDPNTFWKQRDNSQIQQMQLKSRVKHQVAPTIDLQSSMTSMNMGENLLFKSVQEDPKQNPREQEITKYREQIQKLEKELSDWRLASQSLNQQKQVSSEQQNKIETKYLVIAMVVSFIIGVLLAKA